MRTAFISPLLLWTTAPSKQTSRYLSEKKTDLPALSPSKHIPNQRSERNFHQTKILPPPNSEQLKMGNRLADKYPEFFQEIQFIEKKLLLHESRDGENKSPLEIVIGDSQGFALTIAKDIAKIYGKEHFILDGKAEMPDIMNFMIQNPDGIIIVPSTKDRGPSRFPQPSFIMTDRNTPADTRPISVVATLVEKGFPTGPSSPPYHSSNTFLYIIVDKSIDDPNKVFGFHNHPDTSYLNGEIFQNHGGAAIHRLSESPHSMITLDKGKKRISLKPIIESLIPDHFDKEARNKIIEIATSTINSKMSYGQITDQTDLAIAQYLIETSFKDV